MTSPIRRGSGIVNLQTGMIEKVGLDLLAPSSCEEAYPHAYSRSARTSSWLRTEQVRRTEQ